MIRRKRIKNHVFQLTSDTQYMNSGVIITDDFAMVIDTMLLSEDGEMIADFVKRELSLDVKYLINTHWHSDHIGGNSLLADENTIIVAHENYPDTLLREKKLITPKKEMPKSLEDYPQPNITFVEKLTIKDAITLKLIYLPGHSDDAISVYLPEEKVIFVGDTILRWETDEEIVIPYFYWGNSHELLKTYDKLLEMEIDTIIPGHGMACGLDRVEEQKFYVSELKRKFDERFDERPSDEFRDVRKFMVLELPLETVFGKEFRHRNWIDKAHRLNIERLIMEKGIAPDDPTIRDWE